MNYIECYKWKEFLIEGDLLFNYMYNNFNNMFNNESLINLFDIRPARYEICIEDIIGEDEYIPIQNELILWIKNENIEGRLFNKALWKPFRDQQTFTSMYLGYRIIFCYKQFYFQLSISSQCWNYTFCNDTSKNSIHFELSLYGWKIKDNEMLQPDNKSIIFEDKLIPQFYWDIK